MEPIRFEMNNSLLPLYIYEDFSISLPTGSEWRISAGDQPRVNDDALLVEIEILGRFYFTEQTNFNLKLKFLS